MAPTTLNPNMWIDKYSDYLFNFTLSRIDDREVAKDLISETFLSALKAMKNFKGDASERTWLVSILKRKIIDYYRKKNTQKRKAEVDVDYRGKSHEGEEKWLEENVADSNKSSIESDIEGRELKKAVLDCLSKMGERQAAIFKRKTMDGADTKTVCNEFNISPSNLWVTIHRSRKVMADCLEKTGYKF